MATKNDIDLEDELPEEDLEALEEQRVKMFEDAGIDEDEVLKTSRDSQSAWNSYFLDNINQARDDVHFCLRDQWTDSDRTEFDRLKKPALTSYYKSY